MEIQYVNSVNCKIQKLDSINSEWQVYLLMKLYVFACCCECGWGFKPAFHLAQRLNVSDLAFWPLRRLHRKVGYANVLRCMRCVEWKRCLRWGAALGPTDLGPGAWSCEGVEQAFITVTQAGALRRRLLYMATLSTFGAPLHYTVCMPNLWKT